MRGKPALQERAFLISEMDHDMGDMSDRSDRSDKSDRSDRSGRDGNGSHDTSGNDKDGRCRWRQSHYSAAMIVMH